VYTLLLLKGEGKGLALK